MWPNPQETSYSCFLNFFFIIISLCNCLFFDFFDFHAISFLFDMQIFVLPCWQLLFYWISAVKSILGTGSLLNFSKLHLKVESQWGSVIISRFYINFLMCGMYQILKDLPYQNSIKCHSHLYYGNRIDILLNRFSKLHLNPFMTEADII